MHNQKGNTLALTVTVIFIIATIGIFAFFAGRLFAGAREMSNATDAGGLNTGKQLITAIGRPLNTGIELQHFAYLTDTNGNVDLRVYNRIIAQTLLVGLNAQAEGTQQASNNANQLLYAVQGSPNSISKWLIDQLSQPSAATSPFLNVASNGSLRMLGTNTTANFDSTAYAVAYVNPGDATNVYIDQSILPMGLPAGTLSTQTGPGGFPYLAGYTNVNAGVFVIQGTPVEPGQQPHLISNRDFNNGLATPMTGSGGYVPPNAFRTAAMSTGTISTSQGIAANACAIVGALGSAFSASIPEGYLQITNNGATNGSLPGLLSNVDPNWASQVMSQLVQRMREVQPSTSSSDATAMLNGINVAAGQTVYIFMDPTTNLLTCSTNQPPQPIYGTGMSADGLAQSFTTQAPASGSTALIGTGSYTPSCGLNNLLGALVVANYPPPTTSGGSDSGGGGGDGGGGDGGGGCGGGDGGGDG